MARQPLRDPAPSGWGGAGPWPRALRARTPKLPVSGAARTAPGYARQAAGGCSPYYYSTSQDASLCSERAALTTPARSSQTLHTGSTYNLLPPYCTPPTSHVYK